jgi:hypothetical protein
MAEGIGGDLVFFLLKESWNPYGGGYGGFAAVEQRPRDFLKKHCKPVVGP